MNLQDFLILNLMIYLYVSYNYIVTKNNYYVQQKIKCELKNNIISTIFVIFQCVFLEEAIFRVYINEILSYYISDKLTVKIVLALSFSLAHIHNYYLLREFHLKNIRTTISQVVITFLLSYYYLQELSILNSLLVHLYTNLVGLFINWIYYI
jgi:hypothetical protein